ncbi:MAG: hypothetical protein HFE83_10865 [Lachnospiraceae bacterium]|nr:hypothetical protein [Lachnospiraceae bacterium]
MFHIQIICGLLAGALCAASLGESQGPDWAGLLGFFGRILGTCAVLYPFFLCRFFGAGDIKLAALCTGILGVEAGLLTIFFGLLAAAGRAALVLGKRGELRARLWRLMEFVARIKRAHCLEAYPGWEEKAGLMRLGPWLFGGYCLYLTLFLQA